MQYHTENALDHQHKAGRAALGLSCGACFELPNLVYFSRGAPQNDQFWSHRLINDGHYGVKMYIVPQKYVSGAVVNLLQERRRRDSAVSDVQTLHTSIDNDETPHSFFRAVEDRSYQFH